MHRDVLGDRTAKLDPVVSSTKIFGTVSDVFSGIEFTDCAVAD